MQYLLIIVRSTCIIEETCTVITITIHWYSGIGYLLQNDIEDESIKILNVVIIQQVQYNFKM